METPNVSTCLQFHFCSAKSPTVQGMMGRGKGSKCSKSSTLHFLAPPSFLNVWMLSFDAGLWFELQAQWHSLLRRHDHGQPPHITMVSESPS